MDYYTSDLDALHHLQRDVLRSLTYQQFASHAELLPDGMAGNAFNYHLKQLISHKLIVKNSDGYSLSPLGRLVIDSMSLNAKRFKLRPSVGMILVVSCDDKTLMYSSKRQPMLGVKGLPFGKLRVGESFSSTAARMIESREFDVSKITKLHYFAPFNIHYFDNNQLISHHTGQVWKATYLGKPEEKETENGKSFWVDSSKAINEYKMFMSSGLQDVRIDL